MAFKDIIGQEKAINILLGTVQRERIPSAYLFKGESGIGKKFTAINLAKILNCQKTEHSAFSVQRSAKNSELRTLASGESPRRPNSELSIDACDQCPSCRKITAQTHPDFLMISPEKGEIRVDEIRDIEDALSLTPYEGKRKVVIVDDADLMNQSAANAFLKTLEEPPPHSLIILVSSSPDRLPETIRSRCAAVAFMPLSPEKCIQVIQTVVSRQSSVVSQKSRTPNSKLLTTVSRLSMGRPGLAISNDLIEERDWFLRLLKEMSPGSKDAWKDREGMEAWFNSAMTFLRDIAVFRITGREDMLVNTDLKDKISAVSKTTELKDIIECYSRISLLKRYLEFNLNKSITWNYTGFILSKFKRGI